MGWGETISADSTSKEPARVPARPGNATSAIGGRRSRPGSDLPDGLIKKPAVVLDMGEASREQGFRMNGCR